jgi:hypothetical protein
MEGAYPMIRTSNRLARLTAYILSVGGAVAVAACTHPGGSGEGIGFRDARFSEMSAIRDWRTCRDEAIGLDRQAHDEASPARYLASAKLLEKCEADVGPGGAKVSPDERMRAYALGVQNYLKGGDVPQARETLERLKTAFPGADFYYANGASFIDTMEFLTGVRDRTTVGALGISNVDEGFKSELRRAQYWKRN